MFSDETMMRQFHSYRTYVRRPPGERNNNRYCIPSAKYSPSVMIWGSISARGPGGIWFAPPRRTINAAVYLQILQGNLPVIMDANQCTHFQHDGAPCHTAKVVKQWLSNQHIQLLDKWPGSSPDLNPIENCWSMLKKKVASLKPTSLADLVEKTRIVWQQEITEAYCVSLIHSMPSRIRAVLQAKGGNTKY
jgi:DNA-binding IscR family transcriptional regulator